MSKDDDLQDLLTETAKEMQRLTDNPSTWEQWIIYLLKQLEQQAMGANLRDADLYREMLSSLQDSLRTRSRTGGW